MKRKKPYKSFVTSDGATYIGLTKTHEHVTLYEEDLKKSFNKVKNKKDFILNVSDWMYDSIADDHDISDWWDFNTKEFKEKLGLIWKNFKATKKAKKLTQKEKINKAIQFANIIRNNSNNIINNAYSTSDVTIATEMKRMALELIEIL